MDEEVWARVSTEEEEESKEGFVVVRATGLGNFLKILATNFLTKVAHGSVIFLSWFLKTSFFN